MGALTIGGRQPSRALVVGLSLCGFLWLLFCAVLLSRDLTYQSGKLSFVLLLAAAVAPLVVLAIPRLPIYLLAAYSASVPFSTLLMTDTGTTFAKLLGISTGLTLLISMFLTRRFVTPSRSILVLLAFVVYAGISIFWSLDQNLAVQWYVEYLQPILLLAVVSVYPVSRRDLYIIILAAIAGAMLASGYAHSVFLGEGDVQRVRFRLNGERILDPNEFAASLLVPLALTLMQFLRARMGLAKICWLVPLAVLLSGFSVSGSRGAAVATAAMVVYLFWRSPYRLQLLAVMAAAIIRIAASPIGQRFMSPTLHTASGRAGIWKVAFASLHQYWLLGAGIGNFDAAYRQYFLQVFHPDMLRWDRAAHSIVIGSAVELGIVGLVLVLALFYMEFRAVPPGRDAADRDLCDAMRAGVLGLFVCGLSLSLMALKCTWLAFTLVALMRSAILPARNQRRQPLKM